MLTHKKRKKKSITEYLPCRAYPLLKRFISASKAKLILTALSDIPHLKDTSALSCHRIFKGKKRLQMQNCNRWILQVNKSYLSTDNKFFRGIYFLHLPENKTTLCEIL